jgi:hypothetical protein
MRNVLRRDPLAIEPLLVEGTRLLSAGKAGQAERLLAEAAARDPRNPAARFLLAQMYLEEGSTAKGLEQVAALVRRVPGAARSLTPAVAEFAKQPGAARQINALFAKNPALRSGVLETLAADPANTALILAIAGRERPRDEAPDWQTRLLRSLTDNGDYLRAYRLWQRFSDVSPSSEPGLFNPGFEPMSAPPPFNWSLSQSSGGTAEPYPGGLHILYYGREEARLAAQTLVLRPGRYRLTFSVRESAGASSALHWMITCLPGNTTIARQPVQGGPMSFSVPADDCLAQALELRGMLTDTPGTADVYIADLQLTKAAA